MTDMTDGWRILVLVALLVVVFVAVVAVLGLLTRGFPPCSDSPVACADR